MKKLHVMMAGLGLILAITGSQMLKANPRPPVSSGLFNQNLYNPNQACEEFTCTSTGSISCSNYDQDFDGVNCTVSIGSTTLKHN